MGFLRRDRCHWDEKANARTLGYEELAGAFAVAANDACAVLDRSNVTPARQLVLERWFQESRYSRIGVQRLEWVAEQIGMNDLIVKVRSHHLFQQLS